MSQNTSHSNVQAAQGVAERRKPGGDGASVLLTEREREVLVWIADGKRDREISEILGISVFTVSKHVQNILRKLGVENRTAAARLHYTDEHGSKDLRERGNPE